MSKIRRLLIVASIPVYVFIASMKLSAVAAEKKVWDQGDPLPPLLKGSPWPRLHEVKVTARVSDTADLFTYFYAIHTSSKNEFPVYFFKVDLRLNPSAHPFSRLDVTTTHSFEDHNALLKAAKKVEPRTCVSPAKWKTKCQEYPGTWTVDNSEDDSLRPGESRDGFEWVAAEPPGIREFLVDPAVGSFYDDILHVPDQKRSFYEDSPEFEAEVDKGFQYIGRTIAPVAPPDPFTKEAWLKRMESDVEEAHKLGWIKTDEVLDKTKELLGQLGKAKGIPLKKVVQEIEKFASAEKQKGALTDEADALVRLNALYLLRREKILRGGQ